MRKKKRERRRKKLEDRLLVKLEAAAKPDGKK
jgi:hypothetical protein